MVGHYQTCTGSVVTGFSQLSAGDIAGKGEGRGRGRGRGSSHVISEQATTRRGDNQAHEMRKVDAPRVTKVVDEDVDWEDV